MERSDTTGIPALAAGETTVASDIHSEHDLRSLIHTIEINLSESGKDSDPDTLEYIALIKRELKRQRRHFSARPLPTHKLPTISIEDKSPIEHYYSIHNAIRLSNDLLSGFSPEPDGFSFNVRSSFGALKKGMSSARMLVEWYLHSDSGQGRDLLLSGPIPFTRIEAIRANPEDTKNIVVEAQQEDTLSEQEKAIKKRAKLDQLFAEADALLGKQEKATNNSAHRFQIFAELAATLREQETTPPQSSARAQFEALMAQRKHLWETMIKPNKQALEHIKGTPPSGDIDWL